MSRAAGDPRSLGKVLVANRGEIAVRVFHACKELGLPAVAVYSDADARAPHRFAADEAVCIGGAAATESYLRIEAIIDAARQSGARAIHPGYGFLSENAEFARAVEDAGLVFIGPTPENIEQMGDKVQAREILRAAGVPVIPGSAGPVRGEKALRKVADDVGYPLLVKAAGGGGGKGIRQVDEPEDLVAAWERATSEASSSFGDDRVYLEKLIFPARHIEAQILGDGEGNAIFLGERECSLQRNHQKLVEETPSPALDEALRGELREAALRGARAIRYRGAGTLEFLFDENGRRLHFMEMNTRLQVEHPVTEMVTRTDLVADQLRIAAGATLEGVEDPARLGHSVELRIYAEDPYRGFRPSTGKIHGLRLPHAPFTRVDAALREGYEISPWYDSLLAKLIVWGRDREEAVRRLEAMLLRTRIGGIHTTLPLGVEICRWEAFRAGRFHTRSLEDYLDRPYLPEAVPPLEVRLAAIVARQALSAASDPGRAREPHADGGADAWGWAARLEGTGRAP